MRRRGAILIVVLGVLVLLALLATSFVTLQGIESRVARNYTDDVRAKLVAQSGVDTATDRLFALVQEGWYPGWLGTEPLLGSWKYFGSETDESREYELHTAAGEFARLQSRLDNSLNPSFASENEDPQNPADSVTRPRSIKIESQSRGYSGAVGGTYLKNGDLFALKVLDCQSQINVNDGVRWGPRHSVSQNLRRILNVLGAQPEVNIASLGDRLVDSRPPTGYHEKIELRRLVGEDAYDRVADLLTVRSRSNPSVVNPVPLSEEEYRPDVYPIAPGPSGDGYARPVDGATGKKIFRYGHGRDVYGQLIDRGAARPWPLRFFDPANPALQPLSPASSYYYAFWTHDALNPQYVETVERSPVNVNHAARPVLMALTAGLEGFFAISRRRGVPASIGYQWLVHRYQYGPDTDPGASPYWSSSIDNNGSEAGFLYRTVPFSGPPSGMTTPSPAQSIPTAQVVDEILACRYRRGSPHIAGLSYASEPFGGPFRSWQQFNAFVDALVERGLIVDNRPVFQDHRTQYGLQSWMGWERWVPTGASMVISPGQKRFASQAAADVLKANFNPNAQLNELNPDRNLHTLVDKTDLIVHSTEFCFTPMGRFEIESLGYVLKGPGAVSGTILAADRDALTASDNSIVAQCRIRTIVELYFPYHETTQSQFMQGEFGERQALPLTNNNRSTESGPEPDNGKPPLECEWSGYVALPTTGGAISDGAWKKPKGELRTGYSKADRYPASVVRTPTERFDAYDSDLHSHMQFDHCANDHRGGDDRCIPAGRFANPNDTAAVNLADKTEPIPGPYSPVDSAFAGQDRYRLCRSFQWPALPGGWSSGNQIEGTTRILPPPQTLQFAYSPSDLRVDGAYGELGSAFGYDISSLRADSQITMAFWVKPNWYPETSNKVRGFLSMNSYVEFFRLPWHTRNRLRWYGWPRPLPFGVFHFPSASYDDPWVPAYLQPPRHGSLLWCASCDVHQTTVEGGFGVMSPTLNYEFEPRFSPAATEDFDRFTSAGRFNHLRGHEWMHVAISANTASGSFHPYQGIYYNRPKRFYLYINGLERANTRQGATHMVDAWSTFNFSMQGNTLRIGGELTDFSRQNIGFPGYWAPCRWDVSGCPAGTYRTHLQYFADATIDEFYYWRNNGSAASRATSIFLRGRYYRPIDPSPGTPDGDGVYTSQGISVPIPRGLARPSAITSPSPAAGDTTLLPDPLPDQSVFVSAVQWTAMAEDAVRHAGAGGVTRLRPVVRDYRELYSGGPPRERSPEAGPDVNGFEYETVAQMFVVVEGPGGRRWFGPYHNEVWSPVREAHRSGGGFATGTDGSVRLNPGEKVRYVVKLRPGSPTAGTVLLSTPVLEDATLFFTYAHARFISYAEADGGR
jgi:hypothetical protein